MTTDSVQNMAIKYMVMYGLFTHKWNFYFDNARSRVGFCSHRKKIISLSREYIPQLERSEVKDTILHEIAHALVGSGNGHNHIWKQKAIDIGCNGKRLYLGDACVIPKYKGTCPRCERAIFRNKRTNISCSKCDRRYNPDLLFTWEINN